jgi:hypothetical protein
MQRYSQNHQLIEKFSERAGKVKYALFGWLIGLPIPIVLLLLFFRGCDF